MKIIRLDVLENANVFSYKPVLRMQLFLGDYVDTSSAEIPGFKDNLINILPGLLEHKCSLGRKGGFVERLVEGTYPAHIFEHIVLELQNMCGDKVAYGKARSTIRPKVYEVIVAYKNATLAKQCVQVALNIMNNLLAGNTIDISNDITNLEVTKEKTALGPSAQAVYQAAKRRGLPIERIGNEDLLFIGQGKFRRSIWSTVTDRTSLVATDLVGDKYLTTHFLDKYGIPVPENKIVESEQEALELFRQLGKNLVFKPLDGSHGRGVTIGVESAADVRKAFKEARRYSQSVLIEEYIAGRQYRLCVVAGKLVAAAERIPAYVIGDGVHTVSELVEEANKNPLRGEAHDRPLTKIKIDEISLNVLNKQELTPVLVPEAKRVVQIKETANISTGGTAVDVTAMVHPDNIAMAEYVAKLIGLDIAGLDIIASDIAKPLKKQHGAIIEVNAAPGIRMHHYPSAGQSHDVGNAIIESMFPQGETGRIPLIAVTGTNGKTTTVRMLASIFQQDGYKVGMSSTDGVFIGDTCLCQGDCSGPNSARMVLTHPEAEAAILETARGGIVRAGLGFDYCDVGVVTNISEDHLGQDGVETLEDLAFIKSLVLEVVKSNGVAVINADDEFALQLAARVHAEIVYFSAKDDNILVRRHLGAGGRAVFLRDKKICLACGDKGDDLMMVSQIPVTLAGRARHNIENALTATAAAFAYGINPMSIREGLQQFSINSGRLNMFSIDDFQVCVDYGHNLAGYQAMIGTAQQMNSKRIVGVIAAPGDRRNDNIIALGKEAGRGFDRIYIKEDSDLRGRKRGEVAGLLKTGAILAGFSEDDITVVLSEHLAVMSALQAAQAGDLIIIFFEKYDVVMQAMQNYKNNLINDSDNKAEENFILGADITGDDQTNLYI